MSYKPFYIDFCYDFPKQPLTAEHDHGQHVFTEGRSATLAARELCAGTHRRGRPSSLCIPEYLVGHG